MTISLISEIKDSCGYQVTRIYCIEDKGILRYIQEDQHSCDDSVRSAIKKLQPKEVRDERVIRLLTIA